MAKNNGFKAVGHARTERARLHEHKSQCPFSVCVFTLKYRLTAARKEIIAVTTRHCMRYGNKQRVSEARRHTKNNAKPRDSIC